MTAEDGRESEERDDPRSVFGFGELLAGYIEALNTLGFIDPDEVLRDHLELGAAILEDLETYVQCRDELHGESAVLGTLGDYTLRRQIGRGGMGVVYDAWQNSVNRQVALKVLPAGIAADRRACARFLREAQVAGQLNHQNVVRVYSTGVEEGTPWYSMEYVEGATLAQIIPELKEAQPESETPFGRQDGQDYYIRIARVFADVADGLQHAHSKGVIHRDIKPSNLILDSEGRLRILDFGLARLEGQESLTISGDLVGTPLYMSPEQARKRKIPLDHRTDIYSLGATMYEALTGRPPFRGKDHQDTLSQIIERDPVDPCRLNPRVPKDLETILLKCLRKNTGDRYGTAEALGQDLRRFVRGDPVEARPQGRWERLRRRILRNRRWIATGTLIIILLLSSGWLAWQLRLAEKGEGGFRDVTAVKKVNSSVIETSPTYSADGLELYFGSTRPDGLGFYDIWLVSRTHPRGAWSEPRNVKELNSAEQEEPAWLSQDGLRLYYKTNVPMLEAGRGYGGDAYIRLATRTEATSAARWGPAPDEELVEVNAHYSDGFPSLTSDETELYFSSRRAGGAGETDIWVAERPNRNSPWSRIRNLEEINGPLTETSPCVSADGLALWWTSRDTGQIWYACRDSRKSRFEDPLPVDHPVNSPVWECQPEVSRDWPATGSVMYFVRLDKMENSDIYQATWRYPGGTTSDQSGVGAASGGRPVD